MEDLRSAKESEIHQLRENTNRLQIQLNHGHTAFAEFRDKKSVEMRNLQSEIQKLKEQVCV